MFWGWGAEDDNMFYRLKLTRIGFDRPINQVKYTMLTHEKRWKNPKRVKLLRENRKQFKNDGLNSVKYQLKRIVSYSMHTHIFIDVGKPLQELIE